MIKPQGSSISIAIGSFRFPCQLLFVGQEYTLPEFLDVILFRKAIVVANILHTFSAIPQ